MLEILYQHITLQGLLCLLIIIPAAVFLLSLFSFRISFLQRLIIFSGGFLSVVVTFVVFFTLSAFQKFNAALVTGSLFRWAVSKNLTMDMGISVDELGLGLLILISVGFFIYYIKWFSSLSPIFPLAQFFIFLGLLGDNVMMPLLGWIGLSIVSFVLLVTSGGKRVSISFFSLNLLADFFLLAFMFLLFAVMAAPGLAGPQELFNFKSIERFLPYLLPFSTPLVGVLGIAILLKIVPYPFLWFRGNKKIFPQAWSFLIFGGSTTLALYLAFRLSFILVIAPDMLKILGWVGIIIAILMPIFSFVDEDIFTSLQYILVSQVGLILFSVGRGLFIEGVSSFIAFVIFSLLITFSLSDASSTAGGKRGIKELGGLGRRMALSKWAILIGAFSLAGIIPTAGFSTREGLLWGASLGGGIGFWILGFLASFLATFGMFRIAGHVFFGDSHLTKDEWFKVFEGGPTSIIPQILLMAMVFAFSWLCWPTFLGGEAIFSTWMTRSIVNGGPLLADSSLRYVLSIIYQVGMLNAVVLGSIIFSQRREWAFQLGMRIGRVKLFTEGCLYLPPLLMDWMPRFMELLRRAVIDVFFERWIVANLFSTPAALSNAFADALSYSGNVRLRTGITIFVVGLLFLLTVFLI